MGANRVFGRCTQTTAPGFARCVTVAPVLMAGTIAGEPRASRSSGIPSMPAVQRDHSTGGRKAAHPATEVLVCDFLVACGCATGCLDAQASRSDMRFSAPPIPFRMGPS
jgi:hypothetical protein